MRIRKQYGFTDYTGKDAAKTWNCNPGGAAQAKKTLDEWVKRRGQAAHRSPPNDRVSLRQLTCCRGRTPGHPHLRGHAHDAQGSPQLISSSAPGPRWLR